MIPHYPSTRRNLTQIALGARSQWRIGVIWLLLTLIPTLVFGVPAGRLLARNLDRSVHALDWAQQLPVLALGDMIINAQPTFPVLGASALLAFLLTLLLWPLLTGMVIASAKMNRTLGFVGLLQGGLFEYGRMLRMLIWSIVPLGIAGGIGAALLHVVDDRAAKAILESEVSLEHGLAMVVLVILLLLAHVTVEAGRAQFVVDAKRRSAVRAWWRGVRLVCARPLATIGSYVAISLVGLIVIAVLALVRINVPHAAFPGFLVAFIVAELIAAMLVWTRVARLLVLVQLGRPVPLAEPGDARTLH